jgi:hypothetical protein
MAPEVDALIRVMEDTHLEQSSTIQYWRERCSSTQGVMP